MLIDDYGHVGYTEKELIAELRKNPKAPIDGCFLIGAELYDHAIEVNFSDLPPIKDWNTIDRTVLVFEYHATRNRHWFMPEEYKNFDIAKYLLMQCNGEAELQRMGEELLMYADRELFPFLCYLKYMVDTLHKHKVVLGLGRGSSVASFALYKLGVHKVNSLEYDLDIHEFLKDK